MHTNHRRPNKQRASFDRAPKKLNDLLGMKCIAACDCCGPHGSEFRKQARTHRRNEKRRSIEESMGMED